MLRRCQSDSCHARQPTYTDCVVCDEWTKFSNFRVWLKLQERLHGSLDGLQLDKDIIDPSNKVYCPEKCAFVSQSINLFVVDRSRFRGEYPFGKKVTLGQYITPEEAHEAWRKQKHDYSCMLADSCVDKRVAQSLRLRYALPTNQSTEV